MKEAYILVAGSRSFDDYAVLCKILNMLTPYYPECEIHIVSGGARGADALAERYADECHYKKDIFLADWDKDGKAAGYIRNTKMHEFIKNQPNRICVCFWDGSSRGTAHNFELCKKYNTKLIKVINGTMELG